MMMKKEYTLFFSFMIGFFLLNPYLTEALDKNSKSFVIGIKVQDAKSIENKTENKKETDFFFGYLNLVGTVLISEKDRKLNKAIFSDVFNNKRVTYQEGSLLPYGVKLKRVEKKGVILEKQDQELTLVLGAKNNYFRDIKTLRRYGYWQIASNEWVVNSHYLFKSSEDMIKLAIDSGLSLKKTGKNPGIEITTDKVNKMTGLGFKKGDKVIDINGAHLDGIIGLASAYKKMKSSDNLTIKVLRNGKPIELNYWVAKRGLPRYNMKQVLASEKIKKMLSM